MPAPIIPPAMEAEFSLYAGLLRLHLVKGSPLDQLAAEYGFSTHRLRARLAAHLATCAAAIEPELSIPAPPVTTPKPSLVPPAVHIRQRLPQPAIIT